MREGEIQTPAGYWLFMGDGEAEFEEGAWSNWRTVSGVKA